MTIKVFGHLAPDTDSTCAPIVWAWYLSEKKGTPATAYLQGEPNTEAAFVLKHWNVEQPALLPNLTADDQVVIVDTNNPQDLPENINDTQIIQIVDHHRLTSGLKTAFPPDITIRPLACTTTVMYGLMTESERDSLPDHIAGLMLSAILSDTLEFRSPTTTETDKDVAKKLAEKVGVDITEHAQAMFAAKSDISSFSDAELIRMDSKKHIIGDKNFRISALETTLPQTVLDRKDSIIQTMETVATEDGVDEVLLFIVDILNEEATLLIPNDFVKTVAEKSFNVSVDGNQVLLPGVVSRKKQIIPVLKV